MDALEALVNLDGCAATLDRLGEVAIHLHSDGRLAEALVFVARALRQSRACLSRAAIAEVNAPPAFVLRKGDNDHDRH